MTQSKNTCKDQLPSINTLQHHDRHHQHTLSDSDLLHSTNTSHHHHSRLLYFLTDPSQAMASLSRLNFSTYQQQPFLFPTPSVTTNLRPLHHTNNVLASNSVQTKAAPDKQITLLPVPQPLLPPPQLSSQPIAVAAVDDCCNECCPVIAAEGKSTSLENSNQSVILPSIKRKRSVSLSSSNNGESAPTTAAAIGEEPPTKKTAQCKWSSCFASFDTVEDLTPHLYNNHINHQLPADHCSWESCSEQLLDTQALLDHLNSRHLRLLHACRWIDCNERFGAFDTLTVHLSEVHIGSGKSEYRCQWVACERNGKTFTQRQKIMRHMQTHTGAKPFQCQTCHKRFSESTMVVQHMRTHTGEKPFKCDQCQKDFSVSAALTIHKRVHTGEKPFACRYQTCTKRFSESSNLTKHVSMR
jgi:hypothetical protein